MNFHFFTLADQQNLTALFETEIIAGNTGLQIFTFLDVFWGFG